MGDLNYQDVQSLVNREGRPLYPDHTLPVLRAPDARDELKACRHARALTTRWRASPYRLVAAAEKRKDGAGGAGSEYLQAYSDKYKPATSSSATGLDAVALGLDRAFFPEQLWTAYFEPKTKLKAKKLKREKRKLADGGAGDDGGDDDDGEGAGSSDDDEAGSDQEDQPDYDEEEDDEDYGNQYFDNGEGDDVDDGGGGGDDEGTY